MLGADRPGHCFKGVFHRWPLSNTTQQAQQVDHRLALEQTGFEVKAIFHQILQNPLPDLVSRALIL